MREARITAEAGIKRWRLEAVDKAQKNAKLAERSKCVHGEDGCG
jgi:hypothetical protein